MHLTYIGVKSHNLGETYMLPVGKTKSAMKFKPDRRCLFCDKFISYRHITTKYCSTKCGDLYRKGQRK